MWLGYRESPVARDHWDGIVFYSPTIFFGRFVSQIKAAHRCPAYLILRDVFPDWAADVGVMRKGPHYWLFKAFARYQYAVADVIGIESPSNRRYFAPNDGRVRVLANWIDFGITAPSTPFPEVLRNSHVLVYAGNIGVAQDMDNLLRLARSLLARTDWKLLFVGDGTEKNRLAGEVKNQGLTNVALLPEIDPDALRGLLRHCDIGLISLDRRLKSHNVPGKLLSYLEAGLPVLASINPGNELKAFLEASGVGIAVWNGDDAALLDATSKLLDSAALRAAMATAATEACRRYFSSDRVADQILEGFQHLSPSR
jgi:glycosyltransferase involved in cell wall biosynthesis